MCFYTAYITQAFLHKFGYPASRLVPPKPGTSTPLTIHCKRIPFAPYSTLRQRLIDEIIPSDGESESQVAD